MSHFSLIRSASDKWQAPPPAWVTGTVYAAGAFVVPPAAHATGLIYKNTGSSGTSGTEPVWPVVLGGTIPDGGSIVWTAYTTVAILPAELAQFDANQKSCVNADDGGSWSPAALITIAGSGLRCDGPLVVTRGGVLNCAQGYINLDAPSSMKLSATHTGRTRKIMYPFASALAVPRSMWRPRRDTGGMQSLAPMYQPWTAANPQPTLLGLAIRVHQGATLTKVTVGFRVPTTHTQLPSTMPGFRMLAVGVNGISVPMTSIAAGADANGFVYIPKPINTAAWLNNGLGQTFTFTCDQFNVCDRTAATYLLEVQDEQGLTGFPWVTQIMQPVLAMGYGLGPLTGLGTVDGITPVDGSRILVVNNADISQNGIYNAHAGAWTRAADLSNATQYQQGFIVGVQQGTSYGGTYWQPSTNTPSWSPGTTPPGTGLWQSSTAYLFHQAVSPVHYNGFWFLCTTAGTSGGSEPQWNMNIGQTTPDGGTLVWTCVGQTATPLTFVTRPDADTAPTGTALVAAGNVYQAAQVEYDGISTLAFQ